MTAEQRPCGSPGFFWNNETVLLVKSCLLPMARFTVETFKNIITLDSRLRCMAEYAILNTPLTKCACECISTL